MRMTTMMTDGEKNGSEGGSISYTANMLLYQLGRSGLTTDSLTSLIGCLLHSVREARLAVSPGFSSMGCENFNQ
jgi:hypothetical protein